MVETSATATLTLAGDQLSVETNSGPRMDRLLAAMRGLQPDPAIVRQTRRPFQGRAGGK